MHETLLMQNVLTGFFTVNLLIDSCRSRKGLETRDQNDETEITTYETEIKTETSAYETETETETTVFGLETETMSRDLTSLVLRLFEG
jgi:hypothetical protein